VIPSSDQTDEVFGTHRLRHEDIDEAQPGNLAHACRRRDARRKR
jgi:hypothetical protein